MVGAALAFDNGGQNATSWGPATIALVGMTVIAIAVRRELLGGRLGAAWLLSFAALAAWVAISFAWSHDRSATVIEAQRMMLYLAVVAAVVTLVGSAGITWVLAATAAIITGVCVWSLASWDSGERLVGTIGYWNALGAPGRHGSRALSGPGVLAHRSPAAGCCADRGGADCGDCVPHVQPRAR